MIVRPAYLTREEVVELHAKAVELYGGMPGLRDADGLESSLAQPQTCVFGHERFPTLLEKAGAYCFFIVCNHPFCDGNKRTGFLAAFHFLRKNGCLVDFDPDLVLKAVQGAASGELGLDAFIGEFRLAVL